MFPRVEVNWYILRKKAIILSYQIPSLLRNWGYRIIPLNKEKHELLTLLFVHMFVNPFHVDKFQNCFALCRKLSAACKLFQNHIISMKNKAFCSHECPTSTRIKPYTWHSVYWRYIYIFKGGHENKFSPSYIHGRRSAIHTAGNTREWSTSLLKS